MVGKWNRITIIWCVHHVHIFSGPTLLYTHMRCPGGWPNLPPLYSEVEYAADNAELGIGNWEWGKQGWNGQKSWKKAIISFEIALCENIYYVRINCFLFQNKVIARRKLSLVPFVFILNTLSYLYTISFALPPSAVYITPHTNGTAHSFPSPLSSFAYVLLVYYFI